MIERGISVPEKEIFLNNLRSIFKILDAKGVDYRLVGGVAVDAYTEEEFSFRRKSGVVRDIDMVVLSTDKNLLNDARMEIKSTESDCRFQNLFPKVGLNQAYERGQSFTRFGLQIPAVLSGFMLEDGQYYLAFNELTAEIPAKVMAKTVLDAWGLTIPTFYPETILHFYLVRGGSLKLKDLPKLTRLARKIACSPTPGLVHEDFAVFHQFAKEMKRRYPIPVGLFRWFFVLDHLLDDRISDADRLVYGLWRPIQYSNGQK